jgi:RNA polymerase sigma-70 factor (ECF subfamily)
VVAEFSTLLQHAADRDETAFAAIWRNHNRSLVRYLRTLHPRAAEDLASETWFAVARGLRSFDGDEQAFRAWLFTIARRRMIDVVRAERRRPVVECRPIPERPGVDAETCAQEEIATEAALRLIARLPRDQAEVIVLRSIVGLDVERVATLTGRRPGTVRVLAHRGLRRLRELLEADL